MVTNILTIKNPGKLLKLIKIWLQTAFILQISFQRPWLLPSYHTCRLKHMEILKTLNVNGDINWDDAAEFIPAGHLIGEAKPIFTKVEDDSNNQGKGRTLRKFKGSRNYEG